MTAAKKTILGTELLDNIFIIYPFLAGFGLLAIYVLLVDILNFGYFTAGVIVLAIYSSCFDSHHFFATYARVGLDKQYWQANKQWLIWTFVLIIGGALTAAWLVLSSDYPDYDSHLFFQFFRRFVLVLGFYHLIKQNWGFMAIYKRLANEKPSSINWNLIALISGSFIPLIYMTQQTPLWFPDSEKYLFAPEADQVFYIQAYWQKLIQLCFAYASLFAAAAWIYRAQPFAKPFVSIALYCFATPLFIIACQRFGFESVLALALSLCVTTFIISLAVSLYVQSKETSFNYRKWLVFASTLILYFGVILFPLEGNKYIIVAAITIPHNIQYIAFVPIFSKKQYAKSKQEHGMAKKISQRIGLFIAIGLFYGVMFDLGRSGTQQFVSNDYLLLKNIVAVFFATMSLHHYYLDAIIWKFSKNKSLKNQF